MIHGYYMWAAGPKISSRIKFQKALEDFPRTEVWRLQTDGFQQDKGPKHFIPSFYTGMDAGFKYISEHLSDDLSPELLEDLQKACFTPEFERRKKLLEEPSELDLSKNNMDLFVDTYPIKPEEKDYYFNLRQTFGEHILTLHSDRDDVIAAAVSEEGLEELFESLKEASNAFGPGKPAWQIKLVGYGPDKDNAVNVIYFEDGKFKLKRLDDEKIKSEDKAEIIAFLRLAMQNFNQSKAKYLQEKEEKKEGKGEEKKEEKEEENAKEQPPATVTIACKKPLSPIAMRTYVKKVIEKCCTAINRIDPDDPKKEEKKIIACIKLIKELHQTHIFLDGNGRSLILALSVWLSIKYNISLGIILNPSHYVGFSTAQLLNEVRMGHDLFQEYKITRAREYLTKLSASEVLADEKKIGENISRCLSPNPIIAIAQLNEIYLRMHEDMIVPKNYHNPAGLRSLSDDNFGEIGPPKEAQAHLSILEILKNLYQERITLLSAMPGTVWKDIVENYKIPSPTAPSHLPSL